MEIDVLSLAVLLAGLTLGAFTGGVLFGFSKAINFFTEALPMLKTVLGKGGGKVGLWDIAMKFLGGGLDLGAIFGGPKK